jgi:hypothetical protein
LIFTKVGDDNIGIFESLDGETFNLIAKLEEEAQNLAEKRQRALTANYTQTLRSVAIKFLKSALKPTKSKEDLESVVYVRQPFLSFTNKTNS